MEDKSRELTDFQKTFLNGIGLLFELIGYKINDIEPPKDFESRKDQFMQQAETCANKKEAKELGVEFKSLKTNNTSK